jgi:glycosyltransferase involved in cell wall biosynthesis
VRVALVGPYPVEPGRADGGVESAFVNLLAGLAAHGGLELHVLTFAAGGSANGDGAVRVHRLEAPRRLNNVTLYRGARRAVGSALEELRPDVVHAQDALGHGYVCLRSAGRAPVVVSVHGIVRETRKSVTRPLDRLQVSLAGVAVERYCIRHAPYLLQPTPYPAEYFGDEIAGRIVDVGNAVDDALFALEPAPEAGRVLFAGAVAPGKRVHDLIEAVARIPAATLRIAGGTADARYAAAVAERARALAIDGRVTFLGRLSAAQMREEYRRASLLVLPSEQETSPMVIAEAMAAGVPVVATRVGGVPHLVEDARTGFLVEVGDIDAIAQRVTELLGDERLRSSLATAARSRAEQFRAAAVAGRVRSVYEEAVG